MHLVRFVKVELTIQGYFDTSLLTYSLKISDISVPLFCLFPVFELQFVTTLLDEKLAVLQNCTDISTFFEMPTYFFILCEIA